MLKVMRILFRCLKAPRNQNKSILDSRIQNVITHVLHKVAATHLVVTL